MVPTDYNDDLQQDFEIETQPSRTYALRFDGYPSAGKLNASGSLSTLGTTVSNLTLC